MALIDDLRLLHDIDKAQIDGKFCAYSSFYAKCFFASSTFDNVTRRRVRLHAFFDASTVVAVRVSLRSSVALFRGKSLHLLKSYY